MKIPFFKLSVILLFLGVSAANAQALIDLEAGAVFTGYNDVRIPGDDGTRFSFSNDLESEISLFYRVRLNYTIKNRHTISFLYAPLHTQSTGRISKNIQFENVLFPANTETTGDYKFNSYRLTYRYGIVKKEKIEFGLGLTAKIREARIALSSEALDAEKTNVGFVPIINFSLLWNINNQFGLLFEGDALAAPQGRAEDVLLALTYKITDQLKIRGGYRMLEGGADNDEVYTFSLFHYAVLGLSYSFGK